MESNYFIQRKADNSGVLYVDALKTVEAVGMPVAPRGKETVEVTSLLTATYPGQMIPFVYGRRPNYFGMLMESMWILTGICDAQVVSMWNGNLMNFADKRSDGYPFMYGAYGRRIETQIPKVIEKLKNDPESRQGILTISREEDHMVETKDFPCNDLVMFKQRHGALNMVVVNRSNDIHWGLFGVNFPQFAFLHHYIASQLDLAVGEQTHFSDSLHLYLDEPHASITSRMWSNRDPITDKVKYLDFYRGLGVTKRNFLWDPWLFERGIEYLANKYSVGDSPLLRYKVFEEFRDEFVGGLDLSVSFLTFMALLHAYLHVKEFGEMVSTDIIDECLHIWLNDYTVSGLVMDEFPVDWVYAAYCTLMYYPKRSANSPWLMFDKFLNAVGRHDANSSEKIRKNAGQYVEFMANGY